EAISETSLLQIVAIDIGNLQLATPARLQLLDDVEHVRRVDVNARHGIVALRLGRLLFNTHDAFALQLGDAVAVRVVDLLESDPRPVGMAVGLADHGSEWIEKDIVTKDDGAAHVLAEQRRQA